MLARNLILFAAILTLGACSSQDNEITLDDTQAAEREEISGDALSDIYGEDLSSSDLQGPAAGTQADLVETIGDRVLFGYDRYDLTQEAQATLNAQAGWLQKYTSLNVVIEGHADERGTREYNLALGERRANSVRNYLVALGVSPARITTISFGKERPAVAGSNPQAWSQNRRSVLVVE